MEMYEVDDIIPKSRLEKFLKAIITMEVDENDNYILLGWTRVKK